MSQNATKAPTGAAHVDLPQDTKVDAEAMLEREKSLHQPLKEGEPHVMNKGTTTHPPICNVPDDILHHIFSFYLIDIDRIPINRSTQPSVLLSHVCASWRSLVLTHTQYWHKFLICTPSIPHCKDQYDINPLLKIVVPGGYEEALKLFRRRMQHICSLAQAFLERSGTSTLTITLSVWCSDGLMQTEEETRTYAHEYTSLVKLLCGESSRWGVCNFELCNSYSVEPAMRMILNLKAKDVPTLTHMGLAARHVTPHDECGVFVGSCVRSLDLKSGSRPWGQMRVNWATLTDLCYKGFNQHSETGGGHNDGVVHYFGPRSALSLLRLCGSLVTCEFEIEGEKAFPYQDYVYPEEEDILESPLQLKNLHSLSIEGHLFDRETLDL